MVDPIVDHRCYQGVSASSPSAREASCTIMRRYVIILHFAAAARHACSRFHTEAGEEEGPEAEMEDGEAAHDADADMQGGEDGEYEGEASLQSRAACILKVPSCCAIAAVLSRTSSRLPRHWAASWVCCHEL